MYDNVIKQCWILAKITLDNQINYKEITNFFSQCLIDEALARAHGKFKFNAKGASNLLNTSPKVITYQRK